MKNSDRDFPGLLPRQQPSRPLLFRHEIKNAWRIEDRHEQLHERLVVRVREVFLATRFRFECHEKAVSESGGMPFGTVVDTPLEVFDHVDL